MIGKMETMANNKANSAIGDFIVSNAKTIMTCIVFVCGIYIQHQACVMKIEQLEKELAQIRTQVDNHYIKLDNMKLDKAVFETTMKQFSDMSTDIRQIRERLEDILGDHQRHNSSLR